MREERRSCLGPTPAIAWVKDTAQTILVDEVTGESWILREAQATIWDLLSLGYPGEQIAAMLSILLRLPPEQSAGMLSSVVEAWAQAGILCPVEESCYG